MRKCRALLEALAVARNRYTSGATERKRALLRALATVRHPVARTLLEWHRHLLFLRAFPDDAAIHALAGSLLAQIEGAVRRLPRRERNRLEDSGLAGTTSRHTFEAPIAAWLVARFGSAADINWRGVADPNLIQDLLNLVAARAEQEGLDADSLTTRQWVERVAGPHRGRLLAWLLQRLRTTRRTRPLWEALYDRASIAVAWSLAGGAGSTTAGARGVVGLHPRRGFRRLPDHPAHLIATPLPGLHRLDGRRALKAIDLARAALTARCREVYAASYANPDEVYRADLGEGTSLVLMGVVPSRRLSLKSNYAYLLLSNEVAIGYGGVTPIYRQANTGLNVFEAFRGSEAAFLCAASIRSSASSASF